MRKILAAILLSLGVAAASIAAAPPSKTYVFVPGHEYGLGEQQVYVVDRQADLVVRYRDAHGITRTKSYRHHADVSIAMTTEGVASSGTAVLALSTAQAGTPTPFDRVVGETTPREAPSPISAITPSAYYETSAPAVSPSPTLDEHGSLDATGPMADFAPASIILSGLQAELPQLGRPWKSVGEIALPYARLDLTLQNIADSESGQETARVLNISSSGHVAVRGAIAIKGLGKTALRGTGTATAASFVETQRRLLLGTSIVATSHGIATAKNVRGDYDLKLSLAIKLVRYIPGVPVPTYAPGFIPPSGYLGGVASPVTSHLSNAPTDHLAVPAPTNTEFLPPPGQRVTPYPSTLPEVSLPPIPIPLRSDQPIASPPPPPTPTPVSTRY